MSKHKQSSTEALRTAQAAMGKAKKKLYMQAALMCCTVVLTVVALFAMTAAWYTNVIQTGTLVIEAETWGFEGSVLMEENTVIEAAPGDSGVVELSVTNEGESTSSVSVSISKAYTTEVELLKRIYFYVDEAAVINGETVARQYLTNTNGYSYTLFPQDTLLLTEKVSTDAMVHWEWVYDVLGYYFKGTRNEQGKFQASEYLRPVEYDYDNAIFDEAGNLVAVNEFTSLEQFLAALSETDGYKGKFTAAEETVTDEQTGKEEKRWVLRNEAGQIVEPENQCYLIDEENGIWLYLCTRDNIIANNEWDTKYGSKIDDNTRDAQLKARITITGHQLHKEAVTVGDAAQLEKLLNETGNGIVRLENDLVLAEDAVLKTGADVMLDLNGNRIHYAPTEQNAAPVFTVESGASLTVMNGTITGDSANTVAFQTVGGQLTMHNVTMNDVYDAVVVADHTTENPQGGNSIVRITNSTLNTSDVTVLISGDGALSEAKTTLIIQNSTLNSSEWAAVYGNGSTNRSGTDIQIINSTLTGYYTAIYHPQIQSRLTVSGSTLSGMTGVVIKAGTVEIMDSVIEGTGLNGLADPEITPPATSGFLDTGDAIYVETNYNQPIALTISGDSSVKAAAPSAYALRVYPESSFVRVRITGGTFNTSVAKYLTEDYMEVETDGAYQVSRNINSDTE